jgi:hypothetical protein
LWTTRLGLSLLPRVFDGLRPLLLLLIVHIGS